MEYTVDYGRTRGRRKELAVTAWLPPDGWSWATSGHGARRTHLIQDGEHGQVLCGRVLNDRVRLVDLDRPNARLCVECEELFVRAFCRVVSWGQDEGSAG